MSPLCSALLQKVKPDMRTVTSNTLKKPVIRLLVYPLVVRATTSGQRLPAKRTNTRTCTGGMASSAREEGFDEITDWFETLGKAERSHANRFKKALDELD